MGYKTGPHCRDVEPMHEAWGDILVQSGPSGLGRWGAPLETIDILLPDCPQVAELPRI